MSLAFFLGGRDGEMVEIAAMLREAGATVHDRRLAWGARASSYAAEIAAALRDGATPVLVELEDDLASTVDRAGLRIVDHHGARAGAGRPGALAQVHALLDTAGAAPPWTRWRALVAANDTGHIAGLLAQGATPDEVRAVRDADRRAQGVDASMEAEARRAATAARRHGPLTVVETLAPSASAVTDFIDPAYGGPGAPELLVLMPGEAAFFGSGAAVMRLAATRPDGWHGGALPARGFWGSRLAADDRATLVAEVGRALAGAGRPAP